MQAEPCHQWGPPSSEPVVNRPKSKNNAIICVGNHLSSVCMRDLLNMAASQLDLSFLPRGHATCACDTIASPKSFRIKRFPSLPFPFPPPSAVLLGTSFSAPGTNAELILTWRAIPTKKKLNHNHNHCLLKLTEKHWKKNAYAKSHRIIVLVAMNHIKDVHQLPSHRNQANEQLKFIPTTQNARQTATSHIFPWQKPSTNSPSSRKGHHQKNSWWVWQLRLLYSWMRLIWMSIKASCHTGGWKKLALDRATKSEPSDDANA